MRAVGEGKSPPTAPRSLVGEPAARLKYRRGRAGAYLRLCSTPTDPSPGIPVPLLLVLLSVSDSSIVSELCSPLPTLGCWVVTLTAL